MSLREMHEQQKQSLDGRIFFEQIHHDYIYAGISALGCEPD